MNEREFWALGHVSEPELREGLARALTIGARADAVVIAHLAEVEERRLFLQDGFPSLFEYCQRALGLSEGEAFHRINAARVARKFPIVFALLARREINLSALRLLRDHLSADNHSELLAEARGKTKLELQECLARRFPLSSAEPRVRKLPGGARTSASDSSARAALVPVNAASYRVQLDVSRQFKDKLDLACALGSHANPQRELAVLFEQALDLWLARIQSRRFSTVQRPRPCP